MKTRTGIQPDEYPNLTVGKATKLATVRNMQVNLASGNAQSFDGSADATEIGVKGVLPVANGGTGATDLANITVGRAKADGSGNNIETAYLRNNLRGTNLNSLPQLAHYTSQFVTVEQSQGENLPVNGEDTNVFEFTGSDNTYKFQLAHVNAEIAQLFMRTQRDGVWRDWIKIFSGAAPSWVTGTSGSLKLPSAGWYIFGYNDHYTGVQYWDGSTTTVYPLAPFNETSLYMYMGVTGYNGVLRWGTSSQGTVQYYKLA